MKWDTVISLSTTYLYLLVFLLYLHFYLVAALVPSWSSPSPQLHFSLPWLLCSVCTTWLEAKLIRFSIYKAQMALSVLQRLSILFVSLPGHQQREGRNGRCSKSPARLGEENPPYQHCWGAKVDEEQGEEQRIKTQCIVQESFLVTMQERKYKTIKRKRAKKRIKYILRK